MFQEILSLQECEIFTTQSLPSISASVIESTKILYHDSLEHEKTGNSEQEDDRDVRLNQTKANCPPNSTCLSHYKNPSQTHNYYQFSS